MSRTSPNRPPPERMNQTQREPEGMTPDDIEKYLTGFSHIIDEAIAPSIKGLVRARDYIDDTVMIARHSKDLGICPPLSILYAVTMAARTGLRLAPQLKEAYLIKRWHKVAGNVCYFDPDYRGLMKLAMQHAGVSHFSIDVVHKNDVFKVTKGNKQTVVHEPVFENRGDLIAVYSVATFTDGYQDVRFLDRDGVMRHKAAAQLYDGSPWNVHPDQMWMKSMAKDHAKWLNGTPELRIAADAADSADIGRLDPAINELAKLIGATQLALPPSSAAEVQVPVQTTAAERVAAKAQAAREKPAPAPTGPRPKAAPEPKPEPPPPPAPEGLTQNQIDIVLGLTEDWSDERYDNLLRLLRISDLGVYPRANFETLLTTVNELNGPESEPESEPEPEPEPAGPPTLNREHVADLNALIAQYALTADEIATTLDWLKVPALGAIPVAQFERAKNLVICVWLLRVTGRTMTIALNTFQLAHVSQMADSQVLSCRNRLEERARQMGKIE